MKIGDLVRWKSNNYHPALGIVLDMKKRDIVHEDGSQVIVITVMINTNEYVGTYHKRDWELVE